MQILQIPKHTRLVTANGEQNRNKPKVNAKKYNILSINA